MSKVQRGSLMIISGFSGAGKGTVVNELMNIYPEDYRLSVSATTRGPRANELDGVHYYFKTKEAFEAMIKEDAFIEHACYVGNYYGTPKAFVEENLAKGVNVILEIEMQGAFQIKEKMPETLMIFLTPPSIAELEERLRSRGSESDEQIAGRMSRASEESQYITDYDYIVVNETGKLTECVEHIHQIVCDYKDKVANNKPFINELKEDLKAYKKGE